MIHRPDWNVDPPSSPNVPATGTEVAVVDGGRIVRPDWSTTDQRVADAAALHQFDAKEEAANRKLIADGIFTREELAWFRNRPIEEIGLQGQSVERELAEIARLRRDNRHAYNKDYKMQARERELLELRGKLPAKSEPAKADSQPDEAPGLPQKLLDEWAETGGVDHHLGVVRRTVEAITDALDEEERKELEESFDALPASVQTEVYRFLAVDGGSWPAASDAALQEFAESGEGELVLEWGSRAGRKLGIVRGRMGLMLKAMSPEDRTKAEAWFEALPTSHAAAVIRALAG